MKVELINISNNPIETMYKAYRTCYSKDVWEDIRIPTRPHRLLEMEQENDIDKMIDFIKPLVEKGHLSPLEHISVTFTIEGVSRACQTQLVRHRTSKFSIQSQRYIDGSNFDFVIPDLTYIENETQRYVAETQIKLIYGQIAEQYENLRKLNVRKEDARMILPMATTGNIVCTMDLRNFRNFLEQRMCSHAQSEIKELAKEMNKLVKQHVPFIDYKVLRCQNNLCVDCVGTRN